VGTYLGAINSDGWRWTVVVEMRQWAGGDGRWWWGEKKLCGVV